MLVNPIIEIDSEISAGALECNSSAKYYKKISSFEVVKQYCSRRRGRYNCSYLVAFAAAAAGEA